MEGSLILNYEIAKVEISKALLDMYPKLSKTFQERICDYLYHKYQQMFDEICDVIVDIEKPGEGRPLPEGVPSPGDQDVDSGEDSAITVTILGCRENEEKKELWKKAASMGCEWAKLLSKIAVFRKYEGKVIYEFKR